MILENEINNKVTTLLETYAKHELNKVNPPMMVNDVKDHTSDQLNVRRLIEDKSYHVPLRKPYMLRR